MVSKYIIGALFTAVCITIACAVEDSSCALPFWHGKTEDNWPLAGIHPKSKAKYKMVLKIPNGEFIPGKRYRVTIRRKKKNLPFHGFFIIQKQNTSSCSTGEFKVLPTRRASPASVKSGCSELILDGSTNIIKTRGITWVAPSCGCVTLATSIRTSANTIVQDDLESDEIEDRYKVLTKKVCAKKSKENTAGTMD